MTDPTDTDIRSEILNALHRFQAETHPAFPDQYSAIIYTALGTVTLMHEAVTKANKSRSNEKQITLNHIEALANVIMLLQEMVPEEEQLVYTGHLQG